MEKSYTQLFYMELQRSSIDMKSSRTALDENGQVGVFSEMLPCYTIFHKETETFSSIWTEFTADYTEFLQNYQKDIDAYGERKGIVAKP